MMNIKKILHEHTLSLIQQRIDTAKSAMEAAAEAATQETKSSVGDKYETGRAMMQNEKEKNKIQLIKAIQLKSQLKALSPERKSEIVEHGSLVVCNAATFYFSIGWGKVQLENKDYFVVSLNAPLGKAMRGKSAGDKISFQNRNYQIIEIQ